MGWTNGPGELNEFDIHDIESTAILPSAASSGEGGDDMEVWSLDMEDMFEAFSQIHTTNWDNKSSYSIFTGPLWATSSWATYDVTDEVLTKTLPGEAFSGLGGDDMEVWSLDPGDIFTAVSHVPKVYWDDKSSYSIFTGPLWGTPSWATHDVTDTVESIDPHEVNTGEGVTLGQNVFDLNITIDVVAIPTDEALEFFDEDPDPLPVVGAEVIAESKNGAVTSAETSSDGRAVLPAPETEVKYDVLVQRTHFDSVLVEDIDVENLDVEEEIEMVLGLRVEYKETLKGAAGLAAGGGVGFG